MERLGERLLSRRHSPPHVASFWKRGGLDNLRRHPGVGARRAHFGGFVPLSRQAEVGDLECQVFHAVVLDAFSQEDCRKERWTLLGFINVFDLTINGTAVIHRKQSKNTEWTL